MLTMLITTLTQIIFASRLWAYGRNLRMIMLVGVSITATLGLGIADSIYLWCTSNPQLSYWTQTAWDVLIVFTNVVISAYLSYLMWRLNTGFRSTNSIMNLIRLYGILNGAINSAIGVLCLGVCYSWFHPELNDICVAFIRTNLEC
ncbi:hypothetical protein DL93DRAFT_493006 [Clavulina sp. PMI_390]|nr:hypothetical protein DL93DRAFT_493006 [Clavulina sp. PMI_390]